MRNSLWILAALCGGYLVGSLSFAVIVSRLMGLAERLGTGEAGAVPGHGPAEVLADSLDVRRQLRVGGE